MAELYKFTNGAETFCFTPSIIKRTFSGLTYLPTIVIRSEINLIDNFAKSPLTFKFAQDHSFAKDMLANIPETPVLITVYRNDLPYWHGRVLGAKASKPYITVTCDSLYTNIARGGATQKATLLCRHILYGLDCKVIQSSWESVYNVSASTSTIAVAGMTEAVGYFNNGIASMGGQTRRIISQDAGNIYMTHAFASTMNGNIKLYPGCALTKAACSGFNNLINGGMLAHMPIKNPFGSTGGL